MNYNDLIKRLTKLDKKYSVKVIGKTKFNRKIFVVEKRINNSFSTAIFLAGIHAREFISSDVLLKMIEENLFDEIKDFNLSFICMANPDGIDLERGEIKVFSKFQQRKLLKINNGSKDFSLWKANARGVDLNNNFDARFYEVVHKTKPSCQGYPGKKPMSERETKAIARYTKSINPFITISYHTKGEEIYYNFFQSGERLRRDQIIAKRFEKSTGYKIVNVETLSAGGYKDWCVEKLKIPALTIELGSDDLLHPITTENLNEIFDRNKTIASDLEFAYNVYRNFKERTENEL